MSEPGSSASNTHRTARLRKALGPLLGLVIVGLALWGLHGMLRDTSTDQVVAALSSLPPLQALLAVGCTGLSYIVLTQYDRLSLHWLGLRWPWRRSAPGTALAYALGNVSFNALLIAGTVRYSAWQADGVQPAQAAKVALFASIGFWLGYAALGALLFSVDPLRPTLAAIGLALGLAIVVYLLLAWRLPVFRLGRHTLTPPPRLCCLQVAVGMLDVLGISGVLWLLLPPLPGYLYSHFLQAFMLAMVAGSASQAPGGLGVFDSAFLLLLPAGSPVPQALAALLAYRVIYYGLPLLAAGATLLLRQALRLARKRARR